MAEREDIRKFPAQEERVETGPIQFGDDWPGTFFRGDHSAHFAMLIEESYKRPLHAIEKRVLEGYVNTLKGSRV